MCLRKHRYYARNFSSWKDSFIFGRVSYPESCSMCHMAKTARFFIQRGISGTPQMNPFCFMNPEDIEITDAVMNNFRTLVIFQCRTTEQEVWLYRRCKGHRRRCYWHSLFDAVASASRLKKNTTRVGHALCELGHVTLLYTCYPKCC